MRNRVLSASIGVLLTVTGAALGAGSAHADATNCATDVSWDPTGTQISTLAPGQSVISPNRINTPQGPVSKTPVTEAVMQGDGNLVVYLLSQTGGQGPAVWSSGTYGHPGAHAIAQSDGNFVVYDTNGAALWNSGTWGQTGGARLDAGGDLVAGDPHSDMMWNSGTSEESSQWCPPANPLPGQDYAAFTMQAGRWMQSANAWLLMQRDGNFVVVRKRDNATLWSSNTSGSGATFTTLQNDGNLVADKPDGETVWATGTYNNPGDRAVFQTDGNFVIYAKNGTPLWSTGTWQSANQ